MIFENKPRREVGLNLTARGSFTEQPEAPKRAMRVAKLELDHAPVQNRRISRQHLSCEGLVGVLRDEWQAHPPNRPDQYMEKRRFAETKGCPCPHCAETWTCTIYDASRNKTKSCRCAPKSLMAQCRYLWVIIVSSRRLHVMLT